MSSPWHLNVPQTLGFSKWHWIPLFEQPHQVTSVLGLTCGTLYSTGRVFFISWTTIFAGQADFHMHSKMSLSSQDSLLVHTLCLAPQAWLVFSHSHNSASIHHQHTGVWNMFTGKINTGNKYIKLKAIKYIVNQGYETKHESSSFPWRNLHALWIYEKVTDVMGPWHIHHPLNYISWPIYFHYPNAYSAICFQKHIFYFIQEVGLIFEKN